MHSVMAHGDSIGNRDGAKLQRVAAGGMHPIFDRFGQPVQGQVARRDLVPAGGDPNLWLGPVVIGHAYRAQHAA
jgi:hypothetical protein